MTRVYAARCLLRLGPLTFTEFWHISGWTKKQARSTIAALQYRFEIENSGQRGKYSIRVISC